ncbi:MAG: UDP-N-acetylenolpyruvoylglucosamine reductase, partial [Kiritimatiellia bacterium]|nr:UDP-N-acetylenolpyruvoylglucosamine reductase [Lentisphaerota bacterium]
VFRNPPGDFAGRLLDQAGCKGLQVGRAAFTRQHANVIVTRPPAPADDVLALMHLATARVRDRFNVELQPEIVYCE